MIRLSAQALVGAAAWLAEEEGIARNAAWNKSDARPWEHSTAAEALMARVSAPWT